MRFFFEQFTFTISQIHATTKEKSGGHILPLSKHAKEHDQKPSRARQNSETTYKEVFSLGSPTTQMEEHRHLHTQPEGCCSRAERGREDSLLNHAWALVWYRMSSKERGSMQGHRMQRGQERLICIFPSFYCPISHEAEKVHFPTASAILILSLLRSSTSAGNTSTYCANTDTFDGFLLCDGKLHTLICFPGRC